MAHRPLVAGVSGLLQAHPHAALGVEGLLLRGRQLGIEAADAVVALFELGVALGFQRFELVQALRRVQLSPLFAVRAFTGRAGLGLGLAEEVFPGRFLVGAQLQAVFQARLAIGQGLFKALLAFRLGLWAVALAVIGMLVTILLGN